MGSKKAVKQPKGKAKLVHVATGRMSSKETVAQEAKQKKHRLVDADFEQVEIRVLAHMATLPKTQKELFDRIMTMVNTEMQLSPVIGAETAPRIAAALTTYLVSNKMVVFE